MAHLNYRVADLKTDFIMEFYYFDKFDNDLNLSDYTIHSYPMWSYIFRVLSFSSSKFKGFE